MVWSHVEEQTVVMKSLMSSPILSRQVSSLFTPDYFLLKMPTSGSS